MRVMPHNGSKRKWAPECAPSKVSAALDALARERVELPPLEAAAPWTDIVDRTVWRIGWHERIRRQWGLLGEWAQASGQPRAVRRAILEAEWMADRAVLGTQADLVITERCAAKAALRERSAPRSEHGWAVA